MATVAIVKNGNVDGALKALKQKIQQKKQLWMLLKMI